MKRLLISLAMTALLALVSAAAVLAQATPPASPSAGGPLPETIWQLTEAVLPDGTIHTPDDPSLYTIQFLPDGRLTARADCNQVGGSYEIDGDALILSQMISTLVGCPEGSLGSEYTAWLGDVVSFELASDALILSLNDGGTLRFVPSLLGVVWEWHEFLGGDDTVIMTDIPENYTITFQDDGSVLVQGDCNRGSGSYTINAPEIDIAQISQTRMACPDDSLGSEFVADLEEVNSFVFADGDLALALPIDSGILMFKARAVSGGAAEATPVAG